MTQYPMWVLFIRNFLSTFVESTDYSVWHYILWKCFSQVLSWKCGSFLIWRIARNNTHFRIDTCDRSHSAYPYPISIRVWGIVSFIFQLGLSTTFIRINESQLHTFFVYRSIFFGAEELMLLESWKYPNSLRKHKKSWSIMSIAWLTQGIEKSSM